MCPCMPSLHKIGISCSDGARFASVSQHHANARPDATTQGNQLKTLRHGRKAAQTKDNQDTTQGNQLKTLRRGRKAAQTKDNQDTTQGNQLKTLRRGRKAAQTKDDQDTTQGNQLKTLRRGRRTALQRTAFQSSMLRRYTIGSRYAIDSRCATDSGYVAGLGCTDFSGQTRYFVGDPSFRVTTVVRRNLRFS